ncbi:MAG TPA: NADP-dependent oxidoreductase [Thermoguttaceae bacterium]|nr:NADP-dependent oxidoreductase [Thermoguttaceae bacterium]
MTNMNHQIILAARPDGLPKETDFKLLEAPVPKLGERQFLVKNIYLSVDPYMRGRISEIKSYAEPVAVGDVMVGGTVGRVVQSKHPDYKQGDVVVGYSGWQEYAVSDGTEMQRFDTSLAPMSTALGVLGMPGMTAYFGLLEIGQPKPGETVFISGAAGAVGSLVGQIAKIQGCRVVGSAGSDEKVNWLVKDLGFDAAFNYKETNDYDAKLREVCPEGIDVYFDNVGGKLTDAVFLHINEKARVAICGQIDQYNATRPPRGPRFLWHLIVKRARVEGFLVFDFADRYSEGQQQMSQWITAGKIKYRETVVDGLENAPKAFIGLFSGENTGKQLVRLAED